MTAPISVEPPTSESTDYHCSACRRRDVPVAALVTLASRGFALCHVCGRELAARLTPLCVGPLVGDDPHAAREVSAGDAGALAWFKRPLPEDEP